MARSIDEVDYYTLLGVARDATVDAIKAAFHRFAARYHPDRHAGDSGAAARNERIYRRGTEAYRVLTHPDRRHAYDVGLPQGRLRYDPAQSHPGRASRKTRITESRANATTRPFVARANQAIKQGDLRQARLQLKIALGKDPDNVELRRMLSEVERQLG